jgi:hypothetical protein
MKQALAFAGVVVVNLEVVGFDPGKISKKVKASPTKLSKTEGPFYFFKNYIHMYVPPLKYVCATLNCGRNRSHDPLAPISAVRLRKFRPKRIHKIGRRNFFVVPIIRQ